MQNMTIFFKLLLHFLVIVFLTVSTQVGGVVYLLSLFLVKRKHTNYRLKRAVFFVAIYFLANVLVVPIVAPLFGRAPIKKSTYLKAHTFFTVLMYRNYVTPEMNTALEGAALRLHKKHPGIHISYLDANFPFLDKFPLLPHLSHNDGKKIDLSLIYQDKHKQLTNKKRSISGYGVFEGPKEKEYNQIEACKDRGKWQYDFPKYLTFGTINTELSLSEVGTRDLIRALLAQPNAGKFFIEPHLKTRLSLRNSKIRYHGCQAVRHDDHIHFQLH